MINAVQYFLFGAGFMFTILIAWLFLHKGKDMLSRLVVSIMVIMAFGFVKDSFVMANLSYLSPYIVDFANSIDIVVLPLYAFILVELCEPGRITTRGILIHEIPFIVLPFLIVILHNRLFYYIDVSFAVFLGCSTAIWTSFAIPRYHKYLKETFSYDDNINLKWLQSILWAFFLILALWVFSCIIHNPWTDIVYMVLTLTLWIIVCFFIYKHRSVVYELESVDRPRCTSDKPADNRVEIFARIKKLIEEDRIYLNPMLKLSDIAMMTNTNRTYASAYFSSVAGSTFYDHINGLRVKHAVELLANTGKRLEEIAEESGFNSRQSFHRVFVAVQGMTPTEYRLSAQKV